MSIEEDIELKNLVAQTLENKGVLPKIRAELRANVFLALEENPNTREILLKNNELSAFTKVPFSALVLNLIREFLEFFELDFTLSVFDPETKFGIDYSSLSRDKMINELQLSQCNKKNPLLYEIVNNILNATKIKDPNTSGKLENSESQDFNTSQEKGDILTTQIPLNSTYIKKSEVDFTPLSPIENESKNDTNESIKEELMSNNFSESDSSSDVQLDIVKALNKEIKPIMPCNEIPQESKSNTTTNAVSKNTIEIDLLTFTPVKETKSKDKTNITAAPSNCDKTDDKPEKSKSLSVLGDLPPLNVQCDEKEFNMNEIKAIINDWSGKSSSTNKNELSGDSIIVNEQGPHEKSLNKSDFSDYSQNVSQKSDITDPIEDFEEDISDLLNGHLSRDALITVDETISKVSQAADYLESL